MNSWCSLRGCLGLWERCWSWREVFRGAVDLIRSGWFCVWLEMCRMKPHRSGFLAGSYFDAFNTFFGLIVSVWFAAARSETWWGRGVNGKIAACEPGSVGARHDSTALCSPGGLLAHTNRSHLSVLRLMSPLYIVCLQSVSCCPAARHVGLGSRPERQPEGEPDRERHAGSHGQSGHVTGKWTLSWTQSVDPSSCEKGEHKLIRKHEVKGQDFSFPHSLLIVSRGVVLCDH